MGDGFYPIVLSSSDGSVDIRGAAAVDVRIASGVDPFAGDVADPGPAPGATGTYVEGDFTYASTIDPIPDLYAKYAYDPGIAAEGPLPVCFAFHGFASDANNIPQATMRRIARLGFFVLAPGLRGANGAGGSPDAAGREVHDVYDALVSARALFPSVTSPDLATAYGWSGGGGIALGAGSKLPDTFTVYVSVFGISDWGWDTTYGWFFQTPSHRVGLVAQAGDRYVLPGNYRSRDAVEAIPQNLAPRGAFVYLFHDQEDGDVQANQSTRLAAAMQGAGLTNVELDVSVPGDAVRFFHVSTDYPTVEWHFARRARAAPAWTVPASGRVRVNGWLKTKLFEIWLGDTADPKTTAGGGTTHAADVDYDTIARTYFVTPLTGAVHVQVIQSDLYGPAEVQALVTGPTDLSLNTPPAPIALATDIPGSSCNLRANVGATLAGSDVAAWADQSGSGNDFASATNRPESVTVGGKLAVQFNALNTERLDGPVLFDAGEDFTLALYARIDSAGDMIPFTQGSTLYVARDWLVFRHLATTAIAQLIDDAQVATEVGSTVSGAGVFRFFLFRRTGTLLRVQVDGTSEIHVTVPPGPVLATASCIGCLLTSVGHTSPAAITLRELATWPRSITTNEAIQLRQALEATWA